MKTKPNPAVIAQMPTAPGIWIDYPDSPGLWLSYSPGAVVQPKTCALFIVADGSMKYQVKGELGTVFGVSHWWNREAFEKNCKPGTLWTKIPLYPDPTVCNKGLQS